MNRSSELLVWASRNRTPSNRMEYPPDPADREWVEGNPKLVTHLRRERGSGLAKVKKDAFKLEHGRLFCEECKMDPIEVYGQNGEACIEVHHKLSLSAIQAARQTRLKDLKCVCANCHRIIHRELRNTDGP